MDWKNYRLFDPISLSQPRIVFHRSEDNDNQAEYIEEEPENESDIENYQTHDVFAIGASHLNAPLDMSDKWIRSIISTSPGFIENYFARSRLHHLVRN